MRPLPAELAGPVRLALARAQEQIPPARALPGGSVYDLKWDGYRVAIVRDREQTRLWSRQGKDLTDRFPDLAAAAADQLPAGTVVDGEAVIWNGARLDFDLLQRRLVTSPVKGRPLIAAHPASYVAFDVLATSGRDVRGRPYQERRFVLADLACDWRPPLQLSPVTTDLAEARQWFTDYRPAGIEGLVVKGADTVYAPGRRDWIKVKSRESREVIVGGVTGTLTRPEVVVAGLYRGGELVIVGRTVPLSPAQSKSLGALLAPATSDHPWPDEVGSSRFGSTREKVPLTKVTPQVVAEVSADTALQAGQFRHPLRYLRYRADLGPADVPPMS